MTILVTSWRVLSVMIERYGRGVEKATRHADWREGTAV